MNRRERKKREHTTCCISDQGCIGDTMYWGPQTECFSCGSPVCRKCSVVAEYMKYGKQRLCTSCCEQRLGDHGKMLAIRCFARAIGVTVAYIRENAPWCFP